LKNESFVEPGVNKSFYWTNKDVFNFNFYFSVHHPFNSA